MIFALFVSLGLPDAVIGAAWPQMYLDLSADAAGAGLLAMVTSACTIVSAFTSGWFLEKFGTYRVCLASVALTSVALLGFALAPGFWALFTLSIPLGLGAGAVDAALNAYVALHFSTRIMNWLHASWGVGAAIGPLTVGFTLNVFDSWRPAYLIISGAQCALAIVVFFTRGVWRRAVVPVEEPPTHQDDLAETPSTHHASTRDATDAAASSITRERLPWYRLPLIWASLVSFFVYCAIEGCALLWSATYLVDAWGEPRDLAAAAASAFLIGMTAGRIGAGVIAPRVANTYLLRGGTFVVVLGSALICVSVSPSMATIGFFLIGLGCAPIYPATMQELPRRFGAVNTQRVVGIHMGFAYLGTLTIPPSVGVLITRIDPLALLVVLISGAIFMLGCVEYIERRLRIFPT